jgi:SAM-dependent methyltransferase
LRGCRQRHPDLALVTADVGRLPFPDGTFDAIVSLGVVEHFEDGPVGMIRDHARALRPTSGILILTVPYRNWYRRWSDLVRLRLRRSSNYTQRGRIITLRRSMQGEPSPAGSFHQYEFSRRSLIALCAEAALVVEHWQPYGVAWALGDSPLLARLLGGRSKQPSPPSIRPVDRQEAAQTRSSGVRGYLRAAIIEERGGGLMQRMISWVALRSMAHMQLVVARHAPASEGQPSGSG